MNSRREARLPEHLFRLLLVALLAVMAARSVADPDLWGHLQFGQDILRTHHLPSHDPYSFTSDRPWVNHEWLAEVSFAELYAVMGNRGLVLLNALAGASVLVLVGWTLARRGVRAPARMALLLVAFMSIAPQLVVVRPQSFSAALFAVLMATIAAAETGRPSTLLLLGPVFALWANAHGGWIVGIGTIGLWAAGAAVRRTVPAWWLAAGVALACVATLATPYGTGLWAFLSETVGLGRADIEDWQPIWRVPFGPLLSWFVATFVLGVAAWRSRARWPSFLFAQAPVLALWLLSVKVNRLELYFGLAVICLLAPALADLGPEHFRLTVAPSRADLLLVGLLCAGGLGAALAWATRTAGCLPLDTDRASTPDAEPVLFMKANGLRGRLITYYDYGEYAIWHLWPAMRVSDDGRRETVYSRRMQDAHNAFYEGREAARFARDIRADYAWLPRSLPAVAALEKGGWVRLFAGPKSVVLGRAGRETDGAVPAPVTGCRCFPGP